ncbi:glutathione S-transferase family protein [Alteriqipengyuania lutimaris]|uniref:Glutathione S-transferase family protein n=1 Tax=Alteriqipengyuania lutimaris TaxID=1538146 RepID=A0A395LIA3_9SPHN|nr:glutathione S-transferase family protein [Alteriqipengyuania lutimaris]MBB3034737.1 putative glutathione S-transferase [Alteriqipengyuania lutimaris]RDS76411.1 glutathione S-transferase family protein [Alteriqipengyuania lutimaris]
MGFLKNGEWHDEWAHNDEDSGEFERDESAFRNWITPDGSPGPTGEGGFEAEPGRYRLYISLACPWAHRANAARHLKGLTDQIELVVVHWLMKEGGWSFREGSCVTPDPLMDADHLHQVYTRAKPDFSGHVTVPVLWDTKKETIVNNESADILRMLGSAFDQCGANDLDLYPEGHRDEIDALNDRVYDAVNNGVYKAGFATSQEAYEKAVGPLFEVLDELEERLEGRDWLVDDRLTEADIRLWTTLIRFDPVYHTHFKCNIRRIADYPNLAALTRRILALDGIEQTVNFEHIRHHYYESHERINPYGIVPAGPEPLVPGA